MTHNSHILHYPFVVAQVARSSENKRKYNTSLKVHINDINPFFSSFIYIHTSLSKLGSFLCAYFHSQTFQVVSFSPSQSNFIFLVGLVFDPLDISPYGHGYFIQASNCQVFLSSFLNNSCHLITVCFIILMVDYKWVVRRENLHYHPRLC